MGYMNGGRSFCLNKSIQINLGDATSFDMKAGSLILCLMLDLTHPAFSEHVVVGGGNKCILFFVNQ